MKRLTWIALCGVLCIAAALDWSGGADATRPEPVGVRTAGSPSNVLVRIEQGRYGDIRLFWTNEWETMSYSIWSCEDIVTGCWWRETVSTSHYPVVEWEDYVSYSPRKFYRVRGAKNHAPVALADAVSTDEDVPVAIRLAGRDPEGARLTYLVTTNPSHGSLTGTAPALTYAPAEDYHGDDCLAFWVNDGEERSAEAVVDLYVVSVNDRPCISSFAPTSGAVNAVYTYDVEADDPDGEESLAYRLGIHPADMTVNTGTGLIEWTPADGQTGAHPVVVIVEDGYGAADTQSFVVVVSGATAVTGDYVRPLVTLGADTVKTNAGETLLFAVTATDNVGVASTCLTVDGMPLTLDGDGTAAYSSPTAGVFTAVATALDAAGNEGRDSVEVRFIVPGDSSDPLVDILLPETYAEITVPTNVIGTASDANFVRYVLEYSPKGEDAFVRFAEGATSVTDNVLGRLDPTVLRNGVYELRLTAEDVAGNSASTTVTAELTGQRKVGNFTMSFTDLAIPMAGIPITIIRTYDSRVKTKGDFGVGWTLAVKDIELSQSCTMGEHWQQTKSGGIFGSYFLSPTQPHVVTVRFADGRVERFNMSVDPQQQQLVPITHVSVSFTAGPGTLSTLTALAEDYLKVMGAAGPAELVDHVWLTTYDPERFSLTASDGTVYVISEASGLETITEPNGNRITFTHDGMTHSAGKSVAFERDAEGRITTITDPMGHVIRYEYDGYGDLVAVTDQEGHTTRFTYNATHGLLDIVDPLGRVPARNEYDDDGRLVAMIDAEGNRTELTHNEGTRQEVVKDRSGHLTVYEYDDGGNVLAETDALGHRTAYTYDDRGNRLSTVSHLGNASSNTYDGAGNRLSTTDPLGNTRTFAYDSRGKLTKETDPLGNETTFTYDSNGNEIREVDPLGHVTSNRYDSAGNRLSTTDPLRNTTTFAYDASGNLVRETDPLDDVTTHAYDANGNRLTTTSSRTTSTGVVSVVWRYRYDGDNRRTETVDPCGHTRRTEYDFRGKKSAVVDELGHRTEYEYDGKGNLLRVAYPDGTAESHVHDREDRRVAVSNRAGRVTRFEYDIVGRPVKRVHADGTFTELEYDADGRLVRFIDERGNATTYAYDPAGRNTRVTDALGDVTLHEYDAYGNRVRMADANSNAVDYVYDALGRQTATMFADGTWVSNVYDAAGNRISAIDQAGHATHFEYDALGRLICVTDALGNVTSNAYDEAGNRVSQTDANGNTTTFEYDNLGRRTKRTLPLGMSESWTYDAAGRVVAHTDFNGDTTTCRYGAMGRLVERQFPGGAETYTHTDVGKRATVVDSRGTTTFTYDSRDRLLTRTDPGGSSIAYTWNAVGNVASVTAPGGATTNAYDALCRLQSVTGPEGTVTTYAYDNVGNRRRVTYPNGTVAEYSYDALNRLTNLVNRTGGGSVISSYAYTLGPVGNRIAVTEYAGRTVRYAYDATHKLIEEGITAATGGLSRVTYTYDAVGNRLTKSVDGVTNSYTYDANDRLLSEKGVTYSYDANGNTITKSNATEQIDYTYDGLNRMTQAEVRGAAGSPMVAYVYDVDGNRVRRTVDGTNVTTYVVDRNRRFAQVLEERDGTGGLLAQYVYGDDLISQKRGGATRYYHYDGQMSTRALSDASAAVVDAYTFDAFGLLLERTGVTQNDYLYTGEQYDPNVGFYYLRARYYNQDTGRFLTHDPAEGSIFEPATLHRYLYAGADPVSCIDPSGEFFTLIEISMSLTIESIIQSYHLMLFKSVLATIVVAEFVLEPGYELKWKCLDLIMAGYGDQGAWEAFEGARQQIAIGYSMLAGSIANSMSGFLGGIANPIELTIKHYDSALNLLAKVNLKDVQKLKDAIDLSKQLVKEGIGGNKLADRTWFAKMALKIIELL